jgi:serine/threonine-protein kinase
MPTVSEQFPAALPAQYRVQRELGRSAMAPVYLADDGKHDRRVAIKVMHPELV